MAKRKGSPISLLKILEKQMMPEEPVGKPKPKKKYTPPPYAYKEETPYHPYYPWPEGPAAGGTPGIPYIGWPAPQPAPSTGWGTPEGDALWPVPPGGTAETTGEGGVPLPYPSGSGGTSPGWTSFAYETSWAPEWWKAMKPPSVDAKSSWLASMNMLLPFLSPEDQRRVAGLLYREAPEAFKHLRPEDLEFLPPPEDINKALRSKYLGTERAQEVLDALDKLKAVTGASEEKMGKGYMYLRQMADLLREHGGKGGKSPTRAGIVKLLEAYTPTKQEAPKAYGELAKLLLLPQFSAGKLMEAQKTESGRWIFGKPSKRLMF